MYNCVLLFRIGYSIQFIHKLTSFDKSMYARITYHDDRSQLKRALTLPPGLQLQVSTLPIFSAVYIHPAFYYDHQSLHSVLALCNHVQTAEPGD